MRLFKTHPFTLWCLITIAYRLIASLTHSQWHHPDEWYQTAEFANLIVNGLTSYTQEVTLHLRNMSWPALLSLPLLLANSLSTELVGLRVFLVQAFVGILDLGIIWGLWQVLKSQTQKLSLTRTHHHIALAFFVLPYFTIADQIRPSLEHASAIAFWVSLGWLVRGAYLRAGLTSMAIAAFRYPSGLLTAGIFLWVLFFSIKNKKISPLKRFTLGLILGAVIFGIADAVYYGRPWESLWMYTQYNVLTGLSSQLFGEQSPLVYWDYFNGHWGKLLLPFGVVLTLGMARGLVQSALALEPWLLPLIFYLAGHLWIGHREPRFMAPIEHALIWLGVYGLFYFKNIKLPPLVVKISTPILKAFVWANLIFVAHALWGENWKSSGTYFEINQHLIQNRGNTCAIITVKKPLTLYYPWKDPKNAPQPPLGFFPSERKASSHAQLSSRPLIWVENLPECSGSESVLLHVHNHDQNWIDTESCTLLPSGILQWVPEPLHAQVIEKKWLSGPWYRCPHKILQSFKRTELRKPVVRRWTKIETLPALKSTGQDILNIGKKSLEDQSYDDGTYGEW